MTNPDILSKYPGIHPTADVADDAEFGDDVEVGPFTVIYPGVKLGAGTFIGAHCEIGVPQGGARPGAMVGRLVIGEGATIRSGTLIYTDSTFGPRLECGHKVLIRERTVAGENLRIGSLSDIEGDCTFGDYCRVHGNVQVGKESVIGNYVWIFPYVVLTNDPHPPSDHCMGVTLEDFAVIAAHTVVLPGVRLGRESVVAAGSLVASDVPAGMIASGRPAKPLCKASIVRDKLNPAKKAYPWQEYFDRGMPWQGKGYAAWRRENPDAGLLSD